MKCSVIVPVYNMAGYLPRCMASLLAQDLSGCEIILVDDGSTDGTSPALCDRYAEDHRDLVKVIHEENRGLGEARNTGIRAAEGEYLLFVDSDDWLREDALAALRLCARETRADMIVFRHACCMEDGTKVPAGLLPSGVSPGTVTNLAEQPALLWDPPMSWTRLCRKSLFEDNAIRFPSGIWFEDLGTTPKLLLAAKTVVYLDEPLYCYYQRDGSIMRSRDLRRNLEIRDALGTVLKYYEENGAFERYEPYLCVMCADHCMEAARRVLMQDPEAVFLPDFMDFFRERFPDRRKYALLPRLGRKKQMLFQLLTGGHFKTARRIFLAVRFARNRAPHPIDSGE